VKIWILRHGEAEARASSDAARELTARGCDQVIESARQLLGRPLQRIIASPYVRAQQTATQVQHVLSRREAVVTVPWLTPDSDPRRVLSELDALNLDHVLLVSHQPLVGALIGLLVHGSYQHAETMSTASLAELEGEHVLAGGMQLVGVRHV
jgi:phosphohistidine phosphatase